MLQTKPSLAGARGLTELVSPTHIKSVQLVGKCRSAGIKSTAQRGNASMLIWLGKQYLGQKDQPEDSMDREDTDAYFDEAGI